MALSKELIAKVGKKKSRLRIVVELWSDDLHDRASVLQTVKEQSLTTISFWA